MINQKIIKNKNMNLKLKTKIVLTIVSSILFFGTIATLFVYLYSKNDHLNSEKKYLEAVILKSTNEIKNSFDFISVQVEKISKDSDLIDFIKKSEKDYQNQEILKLFNKNKISDNHLAVYFLDKDGNCIVSTDESFVKNNYSFRDYFKYAIQGNPYVDSSVGVTSKELGLYFSHPIYIDSEVASVMVIKMSPDYIENVLNNIYIENSTIMLSDNKGIILFSNQKNRIFKSLSFLSFEERNQIQNSKRFTNIDILNLNYDFVYEKIKNYQKIEVFENIDTIDNKKHFFVLSKIDNLDFFIIFEKKIDLLFGFAFRLSMILGLFVLLAAISAIILIILFVDKFFSPFEKLKKIAEEIRMGNLKIRASEEGGEEISTFAKIFNKMLDEIIYLKKDIEKKVIEQTEEIKEKNKELEDSQKVMLNILEDVEEEKNINEKNRKKFQSLVSNIPGATYRCLFDENYTMEFISDHIKKISGYDAEDFINNKKRTFASIIFKKDLSHVEKKISEAIKNDSKNWEIEYRIINKKGEIVWVFEKGYYSIDSKNNVEFLDGIIIDISERKKIEEFLELSRKDLEKFKLAVENASDHIVITDENAIVIFANKAVEKITGYNYKEIVGKKAGTKENWGGQMSADIYDKLWKQLKKDKKSFVGELKNKRKNGEIYDVIASISPIFDKNDKVKYFVALERDISKEKAVDRAKSEFVSLASHQLRTPLSTVNWYAEMLLDGDAGKLNATQKDYLEEIEKGNKRMIELVNALLNVSRLELGTFMIEPKEVDIKNIADIAIKELKFKIAEKNIKFEKKYDKNVKKMLLDEKLIFIVFQNLLSNAVKYNKNKGKVILEINKKAKDLEIIVSDTGLGIPSKEQAKMFEKMYRAENVKKTNTEGTGLGLYIVKSIIEQSGGEINFSSVENKGTSFVVKIPLTGMKAKKGTKALEEVS